MGEIDRVKAQVEGLAIKLDRVKAQVEGLVIKLDRVKAANHQTRTSVINAGFHSIARRINT